METPQAVWAAQASLGEGALWSSREQALYWVDILGKQLNRYDPVTRSKDSWSFDEEISAVTERRNGKGLVVALRNELAIFDTDTAAMVRLCKPEGDMQSNRLNDGKCDHSGAFWFGSMDFACTNPTGAFYSFDGDRGLRKHLSGITVTNGPTWSLDGNSMFFCDTVRGQVLRASVDLATQELQPAQVWLQFPLDDGVPDGMTTDALGRIWIAHWGGSCVSCHDPVTSREVMRIPLPVSQVTSCTFGGSDLRILFITSASSGLSADQIMREPLAGALFAVHMPTPGIAAQAAAF